MTEQTARMDGNAIVTFDGSDPREPGPGRHYAPAGVPVPAMGTVRAVAATLPPYLARNDEVRWLGEPPHVPTPHPVRNLTGTRLVGFVAHRQLTDLHQCHEAAIVRIPADDPDPDPAEVAVEDVGEIVWQGHEYTGPTATDAAEEARLLVDWAHRLGAKVIGDLTPWRTYPVTRDPGDDRTVTFPEPLEEAG